jgi:hypothetical protein
LLGTAQMLASAALYRRLYAMANSLPAAVAKAEPTFDDVIATLWPAASIERIMMSQVISKDAANGHLTYSSGMYFISRQVVEKLCTFWPIHCAVFQFYFFNVHGSWGMPVRV